MPYRSIKKYKVAILAEPLDNQNAGIKVYLDRLLSGLPKEDGIEYELVRMKESQDNYGLKAQVLRSYNFPGYLLFRKFIQLPLFLRKKNYDAVIEPAHFGPFFLKKNTRRITIIHDLTPILFPEFHPLHSVLLHRMLLKGILRRADLIITNSDNTSQDIIDYDPELKEKIRMVYPSVDIIFKKTESRKVLEKYNLNYPYFLSVGTFEPRKDHITIVKAFEHFKANYQEIPHQLVLAGRKGWKSSSLFEYLSQSKYKSDIHILFEVKTEELPELYSHCSAFIYASIYEGFGFPLIEAHNCGAICLAAENSSLKEIAESFAYFFTTGNESELFQLMDKVFENLIKRERREQIYFKDFSKQIHQFIQRENMQLA